ncbi:PREDICTED: uncharacterized protein LOC104767752 [Camelina sativa]|uniref:Uncharacterized protein LOC104767752 n=1 Tax=Camelina sativa TaxID=90675 RepID=A0ABM0XRU8_CAMSA|nr:PREDICTED: uncharacterized protein LOC104767752 [Camelina sativa]
MALSMELYSQPVLNISNYVTVKLTERNYLLWKMQFESFLSRQGLLGFVNGSTPQPEPTLTTHITSYDTVTPNPAYQAWIWSDQVVRVWLLGSLSEDILTEVIKTTTSQEVWVFLASEFNKVSSSRSFGLRRKLQNTEKKDMPMLEYLRELKSVFEQLESIGSPVSETMKLFAALNGLGREYEPIKTSIERILDSTPSPTLEDVIPLLTAYNDRLQAYNEESDIAPHLPFNTHRSGYNNRGRGRSQRSRGRGSYSNKGRRFHQQISPFDTSSLDFVVSGYSIHGRPVCQICRKVGHGAFKCWHRFDNTYHSDLPAALAALGITDVQYQAGHKWTTDSGATAHITSSQNHLQQSKQYLGGVQTVGTEWRLRHAARPSVSGMDVM